MLADRFLHLQGVSNEAARSLRGAGHVFVSRWCDFCLPHNYAGSFFMGALATLVATPCTAPFMAAAVGYAITQPWYVSIGGLEAIGLGLALPYLLIAFSSSARSWLPKPGIWMLRLKEILAFPVYGTAVWFMYVLSQQVGAFGTTAALAGLVLVAFAAWLYDAVGLSDGQWRRLGVGLSTLAVVGAFALVSFVDDGGQSNVSRATAGETLDWQAFSQAKSDALRADGRPIFIDFTAAWCITCKVNERIALADPALVKVLRISLLRPSRQIGPVKTPASSQRSLNRPITWANRPGPRSSRRRGLPASRRWRPAPRAAEAMPDQQCRRPRVWRK